MMEVVVTTGAISRANLQSTHHHQQTNTEHFTGWMAIWAASIDKHIASLAARHCAFFP